MNGYWGVYLSRYSLLTNEVLCLRSGSHQIGGRAPGAEEVLEEGAGLFTEQAAADCRAVVEIGVVEDIEDGGAAALGIVGAPADQGNPGEDDRARAHGAGFLGDEQRALEQAPIAEGGGGLGDGEDFGVGGGIFEQLDLVVGLTEDFGVAHDQRADGDFTFFPGLAGLGQGPAHEMFRQERWIIRRRGRCFRRAVHGGGGRTCTRRPWTVRRPSARAWRARG